MPIEKQPFRDYNLEDEKKKEDIISLRINKAERQQLERMKEALDIKSDAKAIKEFSLIGFKCMTSLFSEQFLRYLFKKDRQRLSDYKSF